MEEEEDFSHVSVRERRRMFSNADRSIFKDILMEGKGGVQADATPIFPECESSPPTSETTSPQLRSQNKPGSWVSARESAKQKSEDVTSNRSFLSVSRRESPVDERQKVAREIYTTECSYLAAMNLAVMEFKRPIGDDRQSPFTDKENKSIFSNIEIIRNFSRDLVESICNRIESWSDEQCIADVFLSVWPFFKVYQEYCANYDSARDTVKQASSRPAVAEFLQEGQKRCDGKKLDTLLIQPVQRIPRYRLLFQDLLRKTPAGHPDHENCRQLSNKLSTLADGLDQSISKAMKSRQFAGIWKKLQHKESLVAPHREFVSEIKCMIDGESCIVLLFNDILIVARQLPSPGTSSERSVKFGEAEIYEVGEIYPLELLWILTDSSKIIQSGCLERAVSPPPSGSRSASSCQVGRKKIGKRESLSSRMTGRITSACAPTRMSSSPNSSSISLMSSPSPSPSSPPKSPPRSISPPGSAAASSSGEGSSAAKLLSAGVSMFESMKRSSSGQTPISSSAPDPKSLYLLSPERIFEVRFPDLQTKDEWEADISQLTSDWVARIDKRTADGEVKRFGCHMFATGAKWVGFWKDGVPDGEGEFTKEGEPTSFKGVVVQEMREGQGKMVFLDGSNYTGEWKNDMMHGKGILGMIMGTQPVVYDGQLANSKMEGEGTMIWPNGDKYIGEWKEGRMHGTGVYVAASGNRYEGEWRNNRRHGKGCFHSHDKAKYNGYWRNDLRHGFGTEHASDGSIYVGHWHNNQKHGAGSLCFNGGRYEGAWENGLRHGGGLETLVVDGTTKQFYGNFSHGTRDGDGVEVQQAQVLEGWWKGANLEGDVEITYFNGNSYCGTLSAGLRSGTGTMRYADGSKYDGEWKFDLRSGSGTMKYANGDLYSGHFEMDKRSGAGTFTSADGLESYEGGWQNDMRTGKGILKTRDGVFEGEWLNNMRDGSGEMMWNESCTVYGEWKADVYASQNISEHASRSSSSSAPTSSNTMKSPFRSPGHVTRLVESMEHAPPMAPFFKEF